MLEKEFSKSNAIIYAISNEPANKLKQMRESQHLGPIFSFLSDPKALLAAHYAGKYDQGYLKPATIVIGKKGKIVFATSLEDYKVRPAADEVLKAVQNSGIK
jgi:peroxiredoxin